MIISEVDQREKYDPAPGHIVQDSKSRLFVVGITCKKQLVFTRLDGSGKTAIQTPPDLILYQKPVTIANKKGLKYSPRTHTKKQSRRVWKVGQLNPPAPELHTRMIGLFNNHVIIGCNAKLLYLQVEKAAHKNLLEKWVTEKNMTEFGKRWNYNGYVAVDILQNIDLSKLNPRRQIIAAAAIIADAYADEELRVKTFNRLISTPLSTTDKQALEARIETLSKLAQSKIAA